MPWDNDKLKQGSDAKLKACSLKLKLFRLMVHSNRTDYIVTNDNVAICTSEEATEACPFRWKIEQYHREVKQITGIFKRQARKAKAQRKHIVTSILAWIVIHAEACAKNMNIYKLKNQPLKDFQMQVWRRPYTVFT